MSKKSSWLAGLGRRLGQLLSTTWSLLSWPFRATQARIVRWDRNVKRWWNRPVPPLASGKPSWFQRLKTGLARGVRLLLAPLHWLGLMLRGTWTFFRERWQQQRSRYFFQGLPALLLGIVVITLVLLPAASEQDLLAHYPVKAVQAMQKKDYFTARVCYERLTLAYPENQDYWFRLALSAAAIEEFEQAQVLLDKLASPHAPGYPPAQLWRAQAVLKQPRLTTPMLQTAELHLRRVVQAEPKNVEAHLLLARVYMILGQDDKAEPHLWEIAPNQPEYWLDLARLYYKQGKKEQSQQKALEASRPLAAKVRSNLDDHDARVAYAESLYFQGKFDAAIVTLQDGLNLAPGRFRGVLSRFYATAARDEAKNAKPDVGKQFGYLDQALVYDSKNSDALDHLLSFIKLGGPEAERARKTVRSLLVAGQTPAILHLVLGNDAWLQGNIEDSQKHLEQAYRQEPEMAIVANNLAWLLAHREPIDLPHALEMVESALKSQPKNLRFRDTRGHILVKMGKLREALTDLEAALPGLPEPMQTHQTLVAVYDQLGIHAMAAAHRERIQKLQPKKK